MGLTRPRLTQLQDSDFKNSCRAAAVNNITLSGGAPATVDGVNLQVNDRVLVVGQTNASQNGIYFVSTLGSGSNGTWTRTLDSNQNAEVTSGVIVNTVEGTEYAGTLWKLTTQDPITIGSTGLTFVPNLENSNIYVGSKAVTTSQTVINSIASSGSTSVRWTVSAVDNTNGRYKTSTVDVLSDGTDVYISEYAVVLSNSNYEVVSLTADINDSNIRLLGTGDSSNVSVYFQRSFLGSSSSVGYVKASLSVDGMATLTDTQTLTNKTLTAPVINKIIVSPSTTSVNTTATVIDTFVAATYQGAKYLITISNGSNYNIIEALLVHDGTTATVTVYGETSTNASLGDITADISSGNVRLLYTGVSAGNGVKLAATYISA
jgi:hypothetical protein